jgi:hypothetical protein
MPRPPVAVLGAVLVLALAPGSASAAGPGANVSREVDNCGILLPGILPEGQVVPPPVTGLLTIEPSGKATLVCQGQLDPALAPAEAVILTDVDCALGEAGQVAESRIVVRPDGGVTLTCHLNPGSEPFVPGGED